MATSIKTPNTSIAILRCSNNETMNLDWIHADLWNNQKNHVLLSKNTKLGKPKKRSIGQGREWNYNCKIGQSSSKCHDDERKKGLEQQQQQQTPSPQSCFVFSSNTHEGACQTISTHKLAVWRRMHHDSQKNLQAEEACSTWGGMDASSSSQPKSLHVEEACRIQDGRTAQNFTKRDEIFHLLKKNECIASMFPFFLLACSSIIHLSYP